MPLEVVITLVLGFALAMGFFRHAHHTLGQWTPILFLTILPFLTLAANAWLDVTMFDGITLGGHPWEVPVIVFVIALLILVLNASFMLERMGELRAWAQALRPWHAAAGATDQMLLPSQLPPGVTPWAAMKAWPRAKYSAALLGASRRPRP